jgi:hypothetical protein
LTKEDKAREARLRRKYGIGIEDYERRLKQQGGVCGICKKPPKTTRLHVDHDHRGNKIRIRTTRGDGEWIAQAESFFGVTTVYGKSKQEARERARQVLMALTVRGLLCPFCNRGLRYYRDNPEFLANASQYLTEYEWQNK